MTPTWHEENINALRDSMIWGLCTTDAFCMGMDLPDIKLVIQWKASCGLCALWQRFGWAAQGQGQEGMALLLVEKKNTAKGREEKEACTQNQKAQQGEVGKKRKAIQHQSTQNKWPALVSRPILFH
ncbi:hypothetical protein BDQ17DRAFT_1422483 [Cyathus striatus]|nr:hypothetical protein BDQ17DRAFT_1422483 [Cyathus striatus]